MEAGPESRYQTTPPPTETSLVYDQAGFGPQATPRAALAKYCEVLRDRIKDPNLRLYTRGSRKFFRIHLVTDGQQRQEWKSLSGSLGDTEEIISGKYAVVRFPLNRGLPPYLMERSPEGWMLDIAAMARLIGFNHRNEWYFREQGHPWMFAFADSEFDPNGISRKKSR